MPPAPAGEGNLGNETAGKKQQIESALEHAVHHAREIRVEGWFATQHAHLIDPRALQKIQ